MKSFPRCHRSGVALVTGFILVMIGKASYVADESGLPCYQPMLLVNKTTFQHASSRSSTKTMYDNEQVA
jgi:hypothetical protein